MKKKQKPPNPLVPRAEIEGLFRDIAAELGHNRSELELKQFVARQLGRRTEARLTTIRRWATAFCMGRAGAYDQHYFRGDGNPRRSRVTRKAIIE